jgi:hypothetical protein
MRLWLSLIAAVLLIPVALAYTLFTARTTSINCARVDGHVSCSDREHIGAYAVWSKTVENIAIARDMSQSSNGQGVVAETESGDQVQLTSSFLDDNSQADIDNRIHQFIFVQTDQNTLAFDLAPTLFSLAPGAAFTVILAVSALISAVRIGQRFLSGRPA